MYAKRYFNEIISLFQWKHIAHIMLWYLHQKNSDVEVNWRVIWKRKLQTLLWTITVNLYDCFGGVSPPNITGDPSDQLKTKHRARQQRYAIEKVI